MSRLRPGGGPQLTGRGWAAVIGAAVAVAAGALVGIRELYGLAAGLLVMVAGAACWTATRSWDLDVVAHHVPLRATVGDELRVALTVRNRSERGSPPLLVHDGTSGRARDLALEPLSAGRTAALHYRVTASHRGVLTVGPLFSQLIDPFGFARRRRLLAPPQRVMVRPATQALSRHLPLSGTDPVGGLEPLVGAMTEDFETLREYRPGDDLRRVHWVSSARRDTLLVREDRHVRAALVTVVMDLRRSSWPDGGLDDAVSAAASLVCRGLSSGHQVRLCTTAGFDSGFATGWHHATGLLDELAVAGTHDDPPAGGREPRRPWGTVLAVTSTALTAEQIATAVALGRRPDVVVAVGDPARGAPAGQRPGTIVWVPGRSDFATAWDAGWRTGGVRPGTA